jgi:hypothetical protein
MPIIAKQDGDNFEKPTPGTVQGVCVSVHDIGIQKVEYPGKPPSEARKVIVAWELSQRMTQGEHAGKPFMITRFYTLSLSEKANLRKDLENWRGKKFTAEELKGFDIETIIGANCLLSIVATETDKRKVTGVMAVPTGMPALTPTFTTPSERYMEWINKERAKQIVHEAVVTDPPDAAPDTTDDIPF